MAKAMNQPTPPRRILLVAGEASGDLHGAHLVSALRERAPDVEVWAVAGEGLKKEGVRVVFDVADIAGMGLTELAGNFTNLWRAYSSVKKVLREQKPNLLGLIDFPDFNMRIAAVAKRLGIPVLYYITPQVWAWRKRRVKKNGARDRPRCGRFPFRGCFLRERRPQSGVCRPSSARHRPRDAPARRDARAPRPRPRRADDRAASGKPPPRGGVSLGGNAGSGGDAEPRERAPVRARAREHASPRCIGAAPGRRAGGGFAQ